MVKKIVFYEPFKDYIFMLSNRMNKILGCLYETYFFTDNDECEKFCANNEIEILILNYDDICNFNARKIFYMTESEICEDDKIYKYRPVSEVMTEILTNSESSIYINKKREISIEGIFSYANPCFKRVYYEYLLSNNNEDILIINADCMIDITSDLNFVEILYYAAQDKNKMNIKLSTYSGNCILGNVRVTEDVLDLNLWNIFFEEINYLGKFKKVLIILPETIVGIKEFLKFFSKLYYPVVENNSYSLDKKFIYGLKKSIPECNEIIEEVYIDRLNLGDLYGRNK